MAEDFHLRRTEGTMLHCHSFCSSLFLEEIFLEREGKVDTEVEGRAFKSSGTLLSISICSDSENLFSSQRDSCAPWCPSWVEIPRALVFHLLVLGNLDCWKQVFRLDPDGMH